MRLLRQARQRDGPSETSSMNPVTEKLRIIF
jgi:hypothetical protein